MSFCLFETSWEVANKIGGIHTVVSSKARELVGRLGDDYVAIGPWLHGRDEWAPAFEEEPGFESFRAACADKGIPVRVGRWNVPGRPRTLLIGFSKLFEQKDGILSGLWERHRVDSLFGGWDYTEPAMFGHAAGMAIETWLEHFGGHKKVVAQFHEWMTAAGLMYLHDHVPCVGTIFTTHATLLGRALSALGKPPHEALGGRTPQEAARDLQVLAQHSMEGAAARTADVFTTVSAVTAAEAELLHGRLARPVLPNGLDLGLLETLADRGRRDEVRGRLQAVARSFLGEDVLDARLLAIGGRYEVHNKGIDVLLDALARLDRTEGPRVVLFVLVPAAHSGPRREVRERLLSGANPPLDPQGISTHKLIDRAGDPVQQLCARLGLHNHHGSRVKVIQVPIYLDGGDALFGMQYEAALAACDLSVFPSFYEPWGYTPAESIGVGVPTITTDFAGFGVWARENGIGPDQGVTVLSRVGKSDAQHVDELAAAIEGFLRGDRDRAGLEQACLATAQRLAWSDLIKHYDEAFDLALERAEPAPIGVSAVTLAVTDGGVTDAPRLRSFDVSARLPEALASLERVARNLYWSWDPELPELFRSISPEMWEACGGNPIPFLKRAYPRDLEVKAADGAFVERIDAAVGRFDAYMAEQRHLIELDEGARISRENPVAYLCFEFGVHESMRIYSGGLGLLAGDHLKAASDLNLPLVGVGLFYRRGYVRQQLSPNGEQISMDAPNDPSSLPMELIRDAEGTPIEVTVHLPECSVALRAWRVDVGRVPLYLLDADHEGNGPAERELTARLYAGDTEHRLQQEIVLGRGGVRLLRKLGLEPSVIHLNEGHAAFAALERIVNLVRKEDLTFDEAAEVVRTSTAFTTHTPVPAGHDVFPEDLMRRYFADIQHSIGLDWEHFLELGSDARGRGGFNMTYLACSLAGFVNGVAKKHGEVSRGLLHDYWPTLLEEEVPVTHVTNGVHIATWVRPGLRRILGVEDRPVRGADFAERAAGIDRERLWAERTAAKRDLVERCRTLLTEGFERRNDSPRLLSRILAGLDDRALLVGFARRFAPYKRAHLLFQDPDRLQRLLDDSERPVRFLFSGKAHPRDGAGRDILKHVVELSRSERFAGKIFFLEDYDIGLARTLKQGVDVWLNNPIRPLEASGTSGMKCAANGGLNLSILDGWWIEACDGKNGWAIGNLDKSFGDQTLQDQLDNEHLMQLLEEEVVPLYFQRDDRGLPLGWLDRMIHALETVPPFFSTERMVSEYDERAYRSLARKGHRLRSDSFQGARQHATRHAELAAGFAEVEFLSTSLSDLSHVTSGDRVRAEAELKSPALDGEQLVVEVVLGHANGGSGVHGQHAYELEPVGHDGDRLSFRGAFPVEASGHWRLGLRVRPRGIADWNLPLRRLVRWA